MSSESPLVSIFTACKNAEKYIRATLDTIVSQSYKNIEIVIADGESTDQTLAIIKEYAARDTRVKWRSEPDGDALEGFFKALKRTTGKYVMLLPVSDLYLDKNWISKCVDILESKKEVSLVHGYAAYLDEEGAITGGPVINQLIKPLPSLIEFTAYYLGSYCYISELTYCVRRDVFVKCFSDNPQNYPKQDTSVISCPVPEPFLWFLFDFFKMGYLAYYVPVFAAGGRVHGTSRNLKFIKYSQAVAKKYKKDVAQFRWAFYWRLSFDFLDSDSHVFKTIRGKDLLFFKLKILYYRLAVKPSFGYGWNAPLFIFSKLFQVLFDNPKDFSVKLFAKIRNTITNRAD